MRPDRSLFGLTDNLRGQFGARAAGCWLVKANRLILIAFVPGEGLDPGISSEFVEAIKAVPLEPGTRLGIVGAAATGLPTISRASELPPDLGSGRWLRAFDADRSIAVPLGVELDVNGSPRCRSILSVALPAGCPLDDEYVVDRIRRNASEILEIPSIEP